MKLRPPSADHLKINTPRWKLVLGFLNPNLNPVSISVIAIVLLVVLFIGLNLYPKQSTRDYEAAATNTPELEFSDVKLAAYDKLQFSVTYRTAMGGIGYLYLSNTGGIIVRGQVKNTSDRELFITNNYKLNSTLTGPVGVTLRVNDDPGANSAVLKIEDSIFSINISEMTGYYIKPGERLAFEMVSAEETIDIPGGFELEMRWIILDAETLVSTRVEPLLVFERDGSSYVWGEGRIEWHYSGPRYRGD